MTTNNDDNKDLSFYKKELESQKKIIKNAFKVSIIVGFISIFFVVLNLSILFTVAGGVAGSDRKINDLERQIRILQESIQKIKNKE